MRVDLKWMGMVLALVAGAAGAGQRVTVDHSSGNGGWSAFFYGAQNQQFFGPAFELACGDARCLSISSTARQDGTFVGGGTADDFVGTWYAIKQMLVPAGATDISLQLTTGPTDDRATFLVNGQAQVVSFFGSSPFTGTIDRGFAANAYNSLLIEVVNSPSGALGVPEPLGGLWDASGLAFDASLSYTMPVPEPASAALMLAGVAALVSRRLRR